MSQCLQKTVQMCVSALVGSALQRAILIKSESNCDCTERMCEKRELKMKILLDEISFSHLFQFKVIVCSHYSGHLSIKNVQFVRFCGILLFVYISQFVRFLTNACVFFYFGIQLHTMYSMAWYGQANPFTMHVKCSNCTY